LPIINHYAIGNISRNEHGWIEIQYAEAATHQEAAMAEAITVVATQVEQH
jgi:hypothetical protein